MIHILKMVQQDFFPQIGSTHNSGEEGQSLIEFLICFVFAFGLLFFCIKISFNLTNGFMAHYATFVASRVYLVYDSNSNTASGSDNRAFTEARKVFNKFKLKSFIRGEDTDLKARPPGDSGQTLYTGMIYTFKQSFSFSNFVGGTTPVTFVSESFLGREPTRQTCLDRVCKAMENIGKLCDTNITYCDNGC